MTDLRILTGKRILLVDDEVDIVDSLGELLEMCQVGKALTFETASELLKSRAFDAAVLDIMGVEGYRLLKIARGRKIPALMLTAHALSPVHLTRSINDGAYAYVLKDRIAEVPSFLADILVAAQKNAKPSGRWFESLEPVFTGKFGSRWQTPDLRDDLNRMFVFNRDELEKIL